MVKGLTADIGGWMSSELSSEAIRRGGWSRGKVVVETSGKNSKLPSMLTTRGLTNWRLSFPAAL